MAAVVGIGSGRDVSMCIYIYIYIFIQDIRKNFEFEKGSRDRNKK